MAGQETEAVPNVSVETVIGCRDLDANFDFFRDELGFRIETISPADSPAEIVLAGDGTRVRLVRSASDTPARLRVARAELPASSPVSTMTAPNGTLVEVVSGSVEVVVPASRPSLTIVHAADDDAFGAGRAGMGYRDLLPDRWGGRFIASHIVIAEGGDVADYVHFHRIRFQMIFVAAGWVDVVYEDQGEPFRMVAGDCVLQPPEIRHRVLRSSPGLEVIEVGCPAQHDTVAEHTIELPTAELRPDRDFGGQRFVRHIAADAPIRDSVDPAMSARDTGIDRATDGLAGATVLTMTPADSRADSQDADIELTHTGEFAMYVVLAGTAELQIDGVGSTVGSRDAVSLPPDCRWRWTERSSDFEVLLVSLPAGCVRPAR